MLKLRFLRENCIHQVKVEQYELHKPDALGIFVGRQSRNR